MKEDIDLLKLHLVRINKEKSRALPKTAYGDPSKNIKFESEKHPTMKKTVKDKP